MKILKIENIILIICIDIILISIQTMGNLFSRKKQRSYDSVILDELNRPLIPDVQHNIYSRLNELEKDISYLNKDIEEIKNSLGIMNQNIAQHKVRSNNEHYVTNEKIHTICGDMEKLLNNDNHLMAKIDELKEEYNEYRAKHTAQGMYNSETNF